MLPGKADDVGLNLTLSVRSRAEAENYLLYRIHAYYCELPSFIQCTEWVRCSHMVCVHSVNLCAADMEMWRLLTCFKGKPSFLWIWNVVEFFLISADVRKFPGGFTTATVCDGKTDEEKRQATAFPPSHSNEARVSIFLFWMMRVIWKWRKLASFKEWWRLCKKMYVSYSDRWQTGQEEGTKKQH